MGGKGERYCECAGKRGKINRENHSGYRPNLERVEKEEHPRRFPEI